MLPVSRNTSLLDLAIDLRRVYRYIPSKKQDSDSTYFEYFLMG